MQRLKDGEPSVWTRANGSALDVSVAYMSDADVPLVAGRLVAELRGLFVSDVEEVCDDEGND